MTILMPKLSKAPNGDWFARKVIPADVRDAYQAAFGVRQEERFRCPQGTTQGRVKIEFTEWVAEIEGRVAKLRAVVVGERQELTQKQIHALVGRWYDWFVAQYDESPLSPEAWESLFERYEDALSAASGNSLGAPEEQEEGFDARHTALVQARVQELAQLSSFLAIDGTTLSPTTMVSFVSSVANEIGPVAALLRRRAGGDYRPDYHREKFPQPVRENTGTKPTGWNAWEAFEAWVGERKPEAATINRWRSVFANLNEFLEGRDIAIMSDEDAVRWKDQLMSGSRSGRTVNEVWLTAARRVFNWVKDQKKLRVNPFDGVKVAVARSGPTKGKFQEEDAEIILRATLKPLSARTSDHLKLAVRWVPWLCAYTGARSGEMTQLRKQDIQWHRDGFWMLNITPDAGTVKGSMPRTVVLHDHLIEQGFVDFVAQAKPGALFYDPAAFKSSDLVDPLNPPRPPYVIMRQKLADWVRKLGVTDPGVGPNHGWRHTFKRRAARAKIEERIRDAFCGHADMKVGRTYELPDIDELAEAIKEFPRYPVNTEEQPR
ncbi:hypothetical protein OF122_09530 [Pelagibacterium flavum]|uniref:Tyr recombinase domain-containing protein n=1 Tax=Pelagibacterium flavum TaxID=2984530 RepID=A0ABY6IX91_9HYPH|nr:hypothetical protein [Pelagibacterium sp. YIM 151497]UYQ73977.1 hypothetical protein OF122_09530 [Pelagibacterium sp. YIM 151497]